MSTATEIAVGNEFWRNRPAHVLYDWPSVLGEDGEGVWHKISHPAMAFWPDDQDEWIKLFRPFTGDNPTLVTDDSRSAAKARMAEWETRMALLSDLAAALKEWIALSWQLEEVEDGTATVTEEEHAAIRGAILEHAARAEGALRAYIAGEISSAMGAAARATTLPDDPFATYRGHMQAITEITAPADVPTEESQ